MDAEDGPPTERPIKPGRCDICYQQLKRTEAGVRFYRCYYHCVCEYCDEYPDEFTNQRRMECPICEPEPHRQRGVLEESVRCCTNESLQNVLIVIKELGNCMDTASSLAKDLASYLSEMNVGNIYIVADNSNLLQQYLSNISHTVMILNCRGDDDNDIERLRNDIGRIGTLIGFVPSTWEKTARIKDFTNPDRTVLLIYDAEASDMIKHIRGQEFVLFSLGPQVHISLTEHTWTNDLHHMELIPPLSDQYFAEIPDVQYASFRIIFPMVLRSDDPTDLVADSVLRAIDRIRQDTNASLSISFVVDRVLYQNTGTIVKFVTERTTLQPCCSMYTNEQNWIADIKASDLAICSSKGKQFTHWLYRIMDQEIPFLVDAKSGMGVLLNNIYPNATVENNVEDWYKAIMKLLNDRDGEKLNYCIYKQRFTERYGYGFHPVATFMCGELSITLRVNEVGDDGETIEALDACDRQLRRMYNSLESVINRLNLLQLCQKSVRNKCRIVGIGPTALETEKAMIQLFRAFKRIGQTIAYVGAGSLVFHTIPHSAEAINEIKELRANGELLKMLIRYLNLPCDKNVSFNVDLSIIEPQKKQMCVYDADKKVYLWY